MTSIKNILNYLLLLVYFKELLAVAADVCNGRCRQFENVFCNSGTGVCEDCNIYCSSDSPFFNEDNCDKFCSSKDPIPMDVCSNRCINFPETYCNTVTGACDSCSIWCAEDSSFHNLAKCADICPAMAPSTVATSTVIPNSPSPADDIVTAPNKRVGLQTTANTSLQPNSISSDKRTRSLIISIPICAICLVAIIIFSGIFIRRRRRKLKNAHLVDQEQGHGNRETLVVNQTAQHGEDLPTGQGREAGQKVQADLGSSECVIGQGTPPSDSSTDSLLSSIETSPPTSS